MFYFHVEYFVSKNLCMYIHSETYFVSCLKIVKGSFKKVCCGKILSKLFCKMLKPPFQTFSFFLEMCYKETSSPKKTIYIYYQCNMCNMKCNSIKVENRIAIYLLDWLIFCYNLRQVNQFFSLSNPTNNLSVNLVSWDYLCFCFEYNALMKNTKYSY